MAQQSMKSSGVMSAAEAKRIAKRSGKKTARNRFKKSLSLYALLIPGLFMIILFHYVPMYGLAIGFKKYNIFLGNSPFDAIRLSPWVGLANWSKLWIQSKFRQAIINTFVISAMKIVIGFPIPIILALMINEVRGTITKRVLQTVMYLPHFISWVVVGALFMNILGTTGIVNSWINAMGGQTQKFFMDNRWFRWIPVSYTHLDVYKRQVMRTAASLIGSTARLIRPAETSLRTGKPLVRSSPATQAVSPRSVRRALSAFLSASTCSRPTPRPHSSRSSRTIPRSISSAPCVRRTQRTIRP